MTTQDAATTVNVYVLGKPAPQGSKRYLGVKGGKGITVESSKKVAPWRVDVRAAREGLTGFLAGTPLSVHLGFVMPRPVSTPKRATPPAVKRPDIDKLARAVLDAITSAGIYADDSQVVDLHVSKQIAEIGQAPGCHIAISAVA